MLESLYRERTRKMYHKEIFSMKRVISIVSIALVVMMIAALLVACGGPEGKYVVKSIDGKAVEDALKESAEASGMNVDDFLKQMNVKSAEEIVTIELKSDKTAIFEIKMFSSKQEGTWKQDGDKINITIEGETQTFTLKGNELSSDSNEDQKYVFVKK